MRYFIVKNGVNVVDKKAIEGTDEKIDFLVNQFKENHQVLAVSEVDQSVFDGTVFNPPLTSEQQAWLVAKGTNAQAAILFIAKKLGLE